MKDSSRRVDSVISELMYIDSTRVKQYYSGVNGDPMHAPRLTTREARALLRRLGITQLEFARWLGVDGRTVRRWVAVSAQDATPPPPAVVLLLEVVEHFPEVRRWLEDRARTSERDD